MAETSDTFGGGSDRPLGGGGALAARPCYVYRGRREPEAYVFLAQRDAFEVLPDALLARLGGLDFALELALTPDRRLARADAGLVLRALATQGYYLQPPPPREPLLPNDRLPQRP